MNNNSEIDNIIDNLRKLYQQEYGVAVFDIKTNKTKKGIELKGRVLTKSQKDDIIDALRENKENIIKDDIKVLSDSSKRNEIGWVVVKSVGAGLKSVPTDLRSRFVSNKITNEKILRRIRCSQAFKGEMLRVLYKNEDQLVVQQNDLTLGWVNRDKVIMKKKSLYKKWKKGNYAIKGKAIAVKRLHSSESSGTIELTNLIIKEAGKYLGTKYVLGGKSKKGIDCSGLIQIVYKNSLDVILPKHSWDQKEIGKKIKLEDVKAGDLVFLIKKGNKHKHVGIVELKSSVNLIHASLDRKKVIKQDLDKVFENYDFVEVKRIIE